MVLLPPADRGSGNWTPRCRGCTSPNPAPSRRGSRRREEAAESPLQRSQAAAAARHGRSAQRCSAAEGAGLPRLGGAARLQVRRQPVGGEESATAVLRRWGGFPIPSSSSRAAEGASSARPGGRRREGRVKAGCSPAAEGAEDGGAWLSRLQLLPRGKEGGGGRRGPGRSLSHFCGFWGLSDVGALRGERGLPWRGSWFGAPGLRGC